MCACFCSTDCGVNCESQNSQQLANELLSNWYWSTALSTPCRYIMVILCKAEIATLNGIVMNRKSSRRLLLFSLGRAQCSTWSTQMTVWPLMELTLAHHDKTCWKEMHFFWQGKQPHFILISETIKNAGGRDRKEEIRKEKDKKKWQLHWCQTQWEKSVFVSLLPLNLTGGGWSTTEIYSTTKMC